MIVLVVVIARKGTVVDSSNIFQRRRDAVDFLYDKLKIHRGREAPFYPDNSQLRRTCARVLEGTGSTYCTKDKDFIEAAEPFSVIGWAVKKQKIN